MMKLGYLREEFNNLYFQIKHKFLLGLFGNDSIIMDNYISKILKFSNENLNKWQDFLE